MTSSPQPTPPTDKGTRYVILVENRETKDWNVDAIVVATGASAAVLKHVKNGSTDLNGFRVAAVPERSFQPIAVKIETTKTIRLG